MNAQGLHRFFFSPWRLHTICCTAALLAGIFIIWPRTAPRAWRLEAGDYAGIVIASAFLTSFGFLMGIGAWLLLRLKNLKALTLALVWLLLWGGTLSLFMLLSVIADPPPPIEKELPQPIQHTDTLHLPHDYLTGPDSLLIPITPEHYQADTLLSTPALSFLEKEHPDLIERFIASAPRWAHSSADDTFYTKPGHVVMEPPSTGGTPGHVHVAFRRIAEGEPQPAGFIVVKPGDAFPPASAEETQLPDFALDVGGRHYLLLAWRGASHRETAYKAINAAINAVEARFKPLADDPSAETIEKLIKGKTSTLGSTPEIRLCEPPAQYGAYQAELFLNPGEAGTILIIIKELENGNTLAVLNCPAQFSNNPNELFRHDIPGSLPVWWKKVNGSNIGHLFAEGTPLFALRQGASHHYFGAAFEVYFSPSAHPQKRTLIMRRCYKVQSYEATSPTDASFSSPSSSPSSS